MFRYNGGSVSPPSGNIHQIRLSMNIFNYLRPGGAFRAHNYRRIHFLGYARLAT